MTTPNTSYQASFGQPRLRAVLKNGSTVLEALALGAFIAAYLLLLNFNLGIVAFLLLFVHVGLQEFVFKTRTRAEVKQTDPRKSALGYALIFTPIAVAAFFLIFGEATPVFAWAVGLGAGFLIFLGKFLFAPTVHFIVE